MTPALAAASPVTNASPSRSVADAPGADAARVALGRAIFFDANLSEPPGTSCASCHDPARAFAGNHGSTLGVALGSRPGHFAKRNTPSVLYLRFVRSFHLHWEEDAPLVDAYGGFFWDGRADSLAELVAAAAPQPGRDERGERRRPSRGSIAASAYADGLPRASSPARSTSPTARSRRWARRSRRSC